MINDIWTKKNAHLYLIKNETTSRSIWRFNFDITAALNKKRKEIVAIIFILKEN